MSRAASADNDDDKHLKEALAVLISSTRSKKRSLPMTEITHWLEVAVGKLGSYEAVGTRIGLSAKMLRQFSAVKRLEPKVRGLIASRKIDSVDAVAHLAMLAKSDQLVIARALAGKTIQTADVRGVVQLRKLEPKLPIEELLNRITESKTKREYVAEFVVRGGRTEKELSQAFETYIPAKHIIRLEIDGALGRLVLSDKGKRWLIKAASDLGTSFSGSDSGHLPERPIMKLAVKKSAIAKKAAAKKSSVRRPSAKIPFGTSLSVEQLESLTAELQRLRDHPPLTRRQGGTYEGDILGFVKGLRLSARVIYFLRECLSELDCEVSWGHVLNAEEQSCSPECDIIIHSKGHVREWNGGSHPIMHFKFIHAERVHAVVSCKSKLDSIDRGYPKKLKLYGIRKVFLFAECLRKDRLDALRAKAKEEGYGGLWCLYFTHKETDCSIITHDQNMYVEFAKAIRRAVEK